MCETSLAVFSRGMSEIYASLWSVWIDLNELGGRLHNGKKPFNKRMALFFRVMKYENLFS